MGSRGDNGISIGLVQHVVKRTICCFRGEAFASVVYASSHLCRNVSDSKANEGPRDGEAETRVRSLGVSICRESSLPVPPRAHRASGEGSKPWS